MKLVYDGGDHMGDGGIEFVETTVKVAGNERLVLILAVLPRDVVAKSSDAHLAMA